MPRPEWFCEKHEQAKVFKKYLDNRRVNFRDLSRRGIETHIETYCKSKPDGGNVDECYDDDGDCWKGVMDGVEHNSAIFLEDDVIDDDDDEESDEEYMRRTNKRIRKTKRDEEARIYGTKKRRKRVAKSRGLRGHGKSKHNKRMARRTRRKRGGEMSSGEECEVSTQAQDCEDDEVCNNGYCEQQEGGRRRRRKRTRKRKRSKRRKRKRRRTKKKRRRRRRK